ncbi:MATE family efflux transporter [Butyrivibrio sp. FC2001]|uniref:MATE family efflux transporter n=1 Tax=Butyrivibrio sp. FC2001 TaxID=1280671 RepID=UPI00040E200D|nr:MATE family efflux transporter [Butyrivibrio sp. FC2001]
MKNNITDMTKGSPARHILLFALPTLIGNIFQQIYNLADSVIVGRFIGSDAFAAVGATTSITFLFFALCNGIGGGGGIVVSQFYGAHDDSNVKKCIVNTGLIMLLVPVFFGVTGFVMAPSLLKLLGTPELILSDAILYVRYMCVGLLFVSLYNYLSSVLRALGDSRTPLYFLIISTVINIVLDIIFVCVFSYGILGAALATVLAQFISVLLSAVYAYKTNPYFRFSKEDMSITFDMTYKIVRLGVPMSIQFSLIAISAMAVQRIVNSYGTVVVAAFTATNRIEQLIHQPYQTLGASLSTYSGQNYGAKRNDRVYAGYKTGLFIMAVLTAVLVVAMQLFGRTITSMFVTDEQVIALGANGLKITSLFYLALGMIYVVRGVLTGIGDAFFSLFNGVIEVIGRFTIPLLMTSYLGFGAMGIWLSSGIVWFLSGATAWVRYWTYFQRRNVGQHAKVQVQ